MFFESFEKALVHATAVLKENEKYSIIKFNDEIQQKDYVIKVELNSPGKLEQEAKRLIELRNSSVFYQNCIPKIIDFGCFKSGFLNGCFFYVMEFLEGDTISLLLERTKARIDICPEFLSVFRTLADEIPSDDSLTSELKLHDLLAEMKTDYEIIKNQTLLSSLFNTTHLKINGKTYDNPLINFEHFAEKISRFMLCHNLNNGHNLHNNFHGGNVIFRNANSQFFAIDPDVSVKVCDTSFGLARFVYTPLHEQCENSTYTFNFNIYRIKNTDLANVDIGSVHSLNWYDEVLSVVNVIKVLSDKNMRRRLWMSLMQCLLRGIKANYSTKLEFNERFLISHSSAYLFFCFIACWDLIDEIDKG